MTESVSTINTIQEPTIQLSHPLLPLVIATNTLDQSQTQQLSEVYYEVNKASQEKHSLSNFENLGETVDLNDPPLHSNNADEFFVKYSALNVIHKNEIQSLDKLCDEFLENLETVLDLKQNENQQLNVPHLVSQVRQMSDSKSKSKVANKTTKSSLTTSKKKRNFTKKTVDILNAWFFQHLHDPYPTQEEKIRLAQETGVSIQQVNNWFGNKRMRYKRKMMEQSRRMSASQQQDPNFMMQQNLFSNV